MKRSIAKSGVAVVALSTFGLLAVAVALWSTGIRVNTTASFPVGLYRQTEPGTGAKTGDLVLACLPRGKWHREPPWSLRCPDRAMPILKKIAALPNDRVAIAAAGIRVDGRMVPNSKPLPTQVSTATPGIVPGGMVWLLSDAAPDSYDSRYFGPIPLTAIQAVVRPLWVFRLP